MSQEESFKNSLKKKIVQTFTNFFKEEQGNRITSNNTEGFGNKILQLIDREPWPKGIVDDGSKDKAQEKGDPKEAGSNKA